jgi:ABC-type bacteriocin/lantibiotic exporter with double-glycine peptidase domain
MSRYEFILCLVAILSVAWVFKEAIISKRHGKRLRRKSQREGATEAELRAENDSAAEKLKAMEERIRVLEKIITDRESNLHDRFRDLEDSPDEDS